MFFYPSPSHQIADIREQHQKFNKPNWLDQMPHDGVLAPLSKHRNYYKENLYQPKSVPIWLAVSSIFTSGLSLNYQVISNLLETKHLSTPNLSAKQIQLDINFSVILINRTPQFRSNYTRRSKSNLCKMPL
jgi:hypothetical protein